MNTLDIIVIIVVLLSAGFAYMRGFVREILSIVAWIGAAVISYYGYIYLVPFMQFLPRGPIAKAAAAGVVFLVALIVLTIITASISRRVSQSGMSSLDRVFGLVFGLARGAVLVCLGYIALTWYLPANKPQPDWVKEARSKWLLERGAGVIEALVPQVLREQVKTTASRPPAKSDNNEQTGDVENTVRALIAPKPVAKPGPDKPAYKQRDREDMDRLIEQQRGPN